MPRSALLMLSAAVAAAPAACGSSGPGGTGTGGSSAGGASVAGAAGTAGTSGSAGTTGTAGATGAAGTTGAGGLAPLPEGNSGIASRHPGDVGIGSDSDVIFADDFESYTLGADLSQRWDAVYQNQYVDITTDAANVYRGAKALQFTLPQQTAELSDGTDKLVSPELDVLFLRYYSKFMPPYDVVGSSHNGSSISAHYFIGNQATPGVPADGTNKFLANLENWRGDTPTPSPGDLNIYLYHPEQRSQYGDHFFPNGDVSPNTSIKFDYGPGFVSRPNIIPELDRWYCYEYMVKANTPGQRDGRIAIWLDGALVADFPGLRLRDVPTLTIDRFGLSFHIGSNPNGQARKWYDNVVAAKSYIGPVSAGP
ncbi:MAG TPA: hypothetical protein VKQ32_00555 [Polyangia bacterium]|nr:hypothetical protein [Polyangia bacterium]